MIHLETNIQVWHVGQTFTYHALVYSQVEWAIQAFITQPKSITALFVTAFCPTFCRGGMPAGVLPDRQQRMPFWRRLGIDVIQMR